MNIHLLWKFMQMSKTTFLLINTFSLYTLKIMHSVCTSFGFIAITFDVFYLEYVYMIIAKLHFKSSQKHKLWQWHWIQVLSTSYHVTFAWINNVCQLRNSRISCYIGSNVLSFMNCTNMVVRNCNKIIDFFSFFCACWCKK